MSAFEDSHFVQTAQTKCAAIPSQMPDQMVVIDHALLELDFKAYGWSLKRRLLASTL
jgi:hypothetical protein